jgi:hypothetical protein
MTGAECRPACRRAGAQCASHACATGDGDGVCSSGGSLRPDGEHSCALAAVSNMYAAGLNPTSCTNACAVGRRECVATRPQRTAAFADIVAHQGTGGPGAWTAPSAEARVWLVGHRRLRILQPCA